MLKSFVLELHGAWSEVADECICLLTTVQRRAHVRLADYTDKWIAIAHENEQKTFLDTAQ